MGRTCAWCETVLHGAAAANRALGSDVNAQTRLGMALPNAQQQLAGESLRADAWDKMMSADLRQRDLALRKWATDMGLLSGKEKLAADRTIDELQTQQALNQNLGPFLQILMGLNQTPNVQTSNALTGWVGKAVT